MCSHYNLECIKAHDLANWAQGLEAPLNMYASFLTKVPSLAHMMLDEEMLSTVDIPKIGHLINLRHKLKCLIKVLYNVKDETVESLVVSSFQ